MDEKVVKVISCSVAVAVMILLLSGDMIISQFIRVNPNQDMIVEETSFCEQRFCLQALSNQIKYHDTVFVLIGQSEEESCSQILSIFEETIAEYPAVYGSYFDFQQFIFEEDEYQAFLALINDESLLSQSFSVLIFQGGEFKELIDISSLEGLKEQLIDKIQLYSN